MKNFKNQKGITLIALVITIIVLIILAAVSIAMLTGNSGIISNAKNAKELTGVAKYDEAIDLAKSAAKAMEPYGEITYDNIVEQLNTNIGPKGTAYTISPEEDAEEWTVTVDENEYIISGKGSSEGGNTDEQAKAAGLYDEQWNMIKSWDELIESRKIFVDNGSLYTDVEKDDDGYPIDNNSAADLFGILVVDDSVNEIARDGFAWSGINGIIIPDSVTNIGYRAFYWCDCLEFVKIGNVKNIDVIFQYCTNLENVEIGDGVEYLTFSAFDGCGSLKNIVFKDTIGWGHYTWKNSEYILVEEVDVTDPDRNASKIISGAFSDSYRKIKP